MKKAFATISMALASAMITACTGAPVDNNEEENDGLAEASQALEDSLMLHLKLNEGGGSTLVNSGDPAITAAFRPGGAYEWIAAGDPRCIMGSCVRLLGTGSNVNGISTNLGLDGAPKPGFTSYQYAHATDTSMSYSTWVVLEATQTTGRRMILSGEDGGLDWSLVYRQSAGPNFTVGFYDADFRETAAILKPGVRYHLAVTFNTATRTTTAYVNGREVVSRGNMPTSPATVYPILVGENPRNDWNEPMKGVIDEVRVYKRVLAPSPSENEPGLAQSELDAVACDDGDQWTADTFVAGSLNADGTYGAASCQHAPIECFVDADCDDADPYTDDSCVDQVCQHAPIQCLIDKDCNDGDPYTDDTCVDQVCQHAPIECLVDSDCDDQDPTTGDTCVYQVCQHEQYVCGDSICGATEDCPLDCEPPAPAAYWSFENCIKSSVFDDSGYGATGTLFGQASCDENETMSLGNFHGGEDRVEISSTNHTQLHFQDSITVAAWVYPRAMNGFRTIVNQWYAMDSFGLSVHDGNYAFSVAVPGGTWGQHFLVETPAAPNTWSHVAGVYNGSSLAIYVNGQLRNSVAASGTLQQSTRPIVIGNHPSWNAFDGLIDEVRLYQEGLNAAQVAFLGTQGAPMPVMP